MPRPGDFFLSRGPGIRAAAICWWTGCPVSHAAIYVGGGSVVHAAWGGVVMESMWNLKAVAWSTDRLPLTDEQRIGIVAFVTAQVGCRYGWGAFAAAALQAKGFDPSGSLRIASQQWTCTQLVAAAWLAAGVTLTRLAPHLVNPAHLWDALGLPRGGTIDQVRQDAGR